jgi:hypothetical protein
MLLRNNCRNYCKNYFLFIIKNINVFEFNLIVNQTLSSRAFMRSILNHGDGISFAIYNSLLPHSLHSL